MSVSKIKSLIVTMVTPVFILFVLCIAEVASAKEAIGWHWYNEIYPENKKHEKHEKIKKGEKGNNDVKKSKKEDSAMNQIVLLRQAVQEAKAKAILYPTEENMRTYLILQNFIMNQANIFAHMWKKTQLDYPELDYSILHPVQNSAQHVLYAEIRKKEDAAIKTFREKYGLLFFYRGNNPLDEEFAPTIESFSRDNNISLMPVSVDGKKLEVFANLTMSQTDNGQPKFPNMWALAD